MSVSTLSNQSVTIENPTAARDKHGQTGFGSAVTATVRLEKVNKTIKTATSELDPVHAVMGVPANVTIQKGARVTYGTDTFRVMTIAEAVGGDGVVHHRECNLQDWSYV